MGSSYSYSYDDDGNLTARTGPSGTSTLTYDELNRLKSETQPDGKTTSYGFDPSNNLTSLTDPGGTVSYHYGPTNLLSELIEPASVTDPNGPKTTFAYQNDSSLKSRTYPNGVTVTSGVTDGQLTSITAKNAAGNVLRSFDYTYLPDTAGKRTDLRRSVTDQASKTTLYSYDEIERLTGATTKDSAGATTDDRAYSYDKASNRLTETLNGTTTTSTYNDANPLTQTGSTTYSYDANGNQTASSAGRALTYNAADQTTRFTAATGVAFEDFAYLGPNQAELARYGGNAFRNDALDLASATTTSTQYFARSPGGGLIAQRGAGGNQYPITDALGSVIALTDSTGTVTRSTAYDPYGRRTTNGGSASTPYGYAGGHRLTGTDLYHFSARYYDATLGRWTPQDPLNQAADLREANRYAYAGSSPVNFVDLAGLSYRSACREGAVTGGIAGASSTGSLPGAISGAAVGCGTSVAIEYAKSRSSVLGGAAGVVNTAADAYKTVKRPAGRFIKSVGDAVGL